MKAVKVVKVENGGRSRGSRGAEKPSDESEESEESKEVDAAQVLDGTIKDHVDGEGCGCAACMERILDRATKAVEAVSGRDEDQRNTCRCEECKAWRVLRNVPEPAPRPSLDP